MSHVRGSTAAESPGFCGGWASVGPPCVHVAVSSASAVTTVAAAYFTHIAATCTAAVLYTYEIPVYNAPGTV